MSSYWAFWVWGALAILAFVFQVIAPLGYLLMDEPWKAAQYFASNLIYPVVLSFLWANSYTMPKARGTSPVVQYQLSEAEAQEKYGAAVPVQA